MLNNQVKAKLRTLVVEAIRGGAFHLSYKQDEIKHITFDDMPGLGVLICNHTDSMTTYQWRDVEVKTLGKLI